MKIHWSPIRMDGTYSLEKVGESLVLNGEVFDFALLPDGATLPAEAIDSIYFNGPVDRVAGELIVRLMLPNGANASHAARFPEVQSVGDGVVEMPK